MLTESLTSQILGHQWNREPAPHTRILHSARGQMMEHQRQTRVCLIPKGQEEGKPKTVAVSCIMRDLITAQRCELAEKLKSEVITKELRTKGREKGFIAWWVDWT